MSGARILVIDDQQVTLDQLKDLFERAGYTVDTARDAPSIERQLKAVEYDVVFTDLQLGYSIDGIDVLELVKSIRPRTQVVIMTAFSSVESSMLAMRGGAYDYLAKPFNREELLLLAARASEKAALERQVALLTAQRRPGDDKEDPAAIIGNSRAVLQMMRLVGQVARTDATVLILGESGTGKELVARAIHQWSPRAAKPFVAVNCGAIPENLQESEFFGHVKGAFTGAFRTKIGLFEQAHHGTLFLDEVGETSLATQVKLLRFLQSGEVRKVGDNSPVVVDARLVTATNRDLLQMVQGKLFREDLYYRLNIICIDVPPLREREGDVDLLADFFLSRYSRKVGNVLRGFTPEARAMLNGWHWPGNVRELENAVERAVTLSRGPHVEVTDLPKLGRPQKAENGGRRGGERDTASLTGPMPTVTSIRGAVPTRPLPEDVIDPGIVPLAQVERQHIERAMTAFGGSRVKVCRALGISKATLWRKLKEYGWRDEVDLDTN